MQQVGGTAVRFRENQRDSASAFDKALFAEAYGVLLLLPVTGVDSMTGKKMTLRAVLVYSCEILIRQCL